MYEPVQFAKTKRYAALFFAVVLVLSLGWISRAAATEKAPATETETLIPIGHTVGIKLLARGVMVVKLKEGNTPAAEANLQCGDVILSVDGKPITSTEQFSEIVQTIGESCATMEMRRNGKPTKATVTPHKGDDGTYTIGAWIRDSMAGIGTVTYYDPSNGEFGALGHGIVDSDTAVLMPFSSGSLLPSTVKAVKKGTAGEAGELKGNFDCKEDMGMLTANTGSGIFGKIEDGILPGSDGHPVPIAENNEIHPGKACILANVSGDIVKAYAVEITKIFDDSVDGRNLLITVTDPRLLQETGGIVQGMSGSPILQNGKIVGAVTHVLLNDPTRGYGIFIRNMLSASETTLAS